MIQGVRIFSLIHKMDDMFILIVFEKIIFHDLI